mmetsp:Transcript_8363/g.13980  ORF Transcript_8363/g.13980 Transcript_8363/m.13980 type:complete len:149 (+) Transcript_8363:1433-1879(+)
MEEKGIKPPNPVVAFVSEILEVLKMPTSRNVLIAGFLRNFAGCIVTYYLPVFFGKNFPMFKAEYAIVNAGIQSVFGFLASVVSGVMADKFEKKTYWAKGIILMLGQGLAAPLICSVVLTTSSFWWSISMFMVYFLIASTYAGPAITMM